MHLYSPEDYALITYDQMRDPVGIKKLQTGNYAATAYYWFIFGVFGIVFTVLIGYYYRQWHFGQLFRYYQRRYANGYLRRALPDCHDSYVCVFVGSHEKNKACRYARKLRQAAKRNGKQRNNTIISRPHFCRSFFGAVFLSAKPNFRGSRSVFCGNAACFQLQSAFTNGI